MCKILFADQKKNHLKHFSVLQYNTDHASFAVPLDEALQRCSDGSDSQMVVYKNHDPFKSLQRYSHVMLMQ